MKTSNDLVHYKLRPAKHVERKMLVEALWRLQSFGHLKDYQYIGFGGRYFADFSLFHRQLGITRMFSIEKDAGNPRYEFNKPYEFVRMLFGESRIVLNAYKDWERRMILWLDYDGPIHASQLLDISEACGRMSSGSVLIVTVQAQPERNGLATLRAQVDPAKIPAAVQTDRDLKHWKTARVYGRIIATEVKGAMAARNAGKPPGGPFAFEPIFHFNYQDGAKMMTYGGVVFADADRPKFDACAFGDLPYIVRPTTADPDPAPYVIEVPFITHREARHLDRGIPADMARFAPETGVPGPDVKRYQEIYRYFPAFSDSDL